MKRRWTFMEAVGRLFAVVGTCLALMVVALAVHAAYTGYVRGEKLREVKNELKIQRERTLQDALELYNQTHGATQ